MATKKQDNQIEALKKTEVGHWVINGLYFGYPKCCIIHFCTRKTWDLSVKQRAVIDGNGFIPCERCSKKILKGDATIESLINNRENPKPYPHDDMDDMLDL